MNEQAAASTIIYDQDSYNKRKHPKIPRSKSIEDLVGSN
mgnify:CR=1 FL=1